MAAPAIGIRPRWTPTVATKVDDTDPLASSLVGAWLPVPGYGAHNLNGKGPHLSLSQAPGHAATVFGPAMRNDAGQEGAVFVTGTSGPLSLQPPISFMWVGQAHGTATQFGDLFGCVYDNADSSPYSCWTVGFADGANGFRWSHNDNGSDFRPDNGGALTVGVPSVLIGVYSPAAASKFAFVNGAVVVNGVAAPGTIGYSATSTFGFNYYGSSRTTNTDANFGAVWNRVLSLAEVARLSADPFCFLRR